MKTIQYRYPFSDTPIILNKVISFQIGIQNLYTNPLHKELNFTLPIRINGNNYSLTEKDILEFQYTYERNVFIEILEKNNPYLIIDIAYEELK